MIRISGKREKISEEERKVFGELCHGCQTGDHVMLSIDVLENVRMFRFHP